VNYHGRILQDDMAVVSVSGPDRNAMLRELVHYANMYEAEGLIVIQTRHGKQRWKRVLV